MIRDHLTGKHSQLDAAQIIMLMEQKRNFILTEVRKFAESLPPGFKERLSREVQITFAESLLDGTVFSIVESLKDVQRLCENRLYQDRQQRLIELQGVPDLDEQMRLIDVNIVKELDEIVSQQQSTLSQAGVPIIQVTQDPQEITLQMEIIRFIITVHSKISYGFS
ncbi:hypothetical protein AB6A40_007271 [Gnathostoma spinigerum]|uniref:Uncharacterized protein n=1 Tax=Gnathostoma spinigerum TaxID=75299 RepID=A0ABD6EMY0_9BILA